MKVNKFIIGFYGILLMAFIACSGGTGSADNNMADDNKAPAMDNSAKVTEEDDDEDLAFILPSPLQIASIFRRAGLEYRTNLTNKPENKPKYSSQLSKSLNFGVYSADLSYCVLNNQSQEAMNYLKVIKELADEIGLSQIFNGEELYASFEKNLGIEDSMVYVLATIQEQLDEYLDDTDQMYLSAIYFAGGWVEAMHIAAKLSDDQSNKKLSARLTEQMSILENVIKGLKSNPNKSEELDAVIKDLVGIEQVYVNSATYKNLLELEEYDLSDLELSAEELTKIRAKILDLRTKIVNG